MWQARTSDSFISLTFAVLVGEGPAVTPFIKGNGSPEKAVPCSASVSSWCQEVGAIFWFGPGKGPEQADLGRAAALAHGQYVRGGLQEEKPPFDHTRLSPRAQARASDMLGGPDVRVSVRTCKGGPRSSSIVLLIFR